MKKSLLIGLVFLLATCSVAFGQVSLNLSRIQKLVQHGAVLLNDETGKRLVSINADEPLIPASTIKVLTAMIALDILGEDYRFTTEIYADANGNIAVKGYGDPYLVSDEIRLIGARLRRMGITAAQKLYLDHSYFAPNLSIPGVSRSNNPYDALNGALSVNFNTVHLKQDRSGTVLSGEPETPLTDLARRKAAGIARGRDARISLSSRPEDCRQYAGELILAIFQEQGISFADQVADKTRVNADWRLLFIHRNSRTLSEVLEGLLRYSNNYIANQVFLVLGAAAYGPPATLVKGKQVFDAYIKDRLCLPSGQLTVWEGSGISRQTLVTGNAMMQIMEQFRSRSNLLTPKLGHPVKGGTLNGVYNLAGYVKTKAGLRPFVILLNQRQNARDEVFRLLVDYRELD